MADQPDNGILLARDWKEKEIYAAKVYIQFNIIGINSSSTSFETQNSK